MGVLVEGVDEAAHGGFGEVAAFAVEPFLVLFKKDRADEAGDEPRSGKIWTTSARRLISRLRRSVGLLDQILRQCSVGIVANAVRSAWALSSIAAISVKPEASRLSVTCR